MSNKNHANRMQDKVMQVVASRLGALIDGCAIIRRVSIRNGEWRGRYEGQRVIRLAGNVWQMA